MCKPVGLRAPLASFTPVWQVPAQMTSYLEKSRHSKFDRFLPRGLHDVELYLNFGPILHANKYAYVLPAIFSPIGQAHHSRGFYFEKSGLFQNFPHFEKPGPKWLNLTKILSLFKVQSCGPRPSPARFSLPLLKWLLILGNQPCKFITCTAVPLLKWLLI